MCVYVSWLCLFFFWPLASKMKDWPLSHSPSAIRQDIMLPALQIVCAADGVEDLLAWFEAEVVRVVQA